MCADRQREELESLRSIYPDDIQVLQEDEKGELEYSVHIQSDDSTLIEKDRCKCKLRFRYPKRYPDRATHVEVITGNGLLDEEVEELKSNLMAIARENIGNVCAYEIVYSAREYVSSHQRPPTKPLNVMREERIQMEQDRIINEQQQTAKQKQKIQEDILAADRAAEEEAVQNELERRKRFQLSAMTFERGLSYESSSSEISDEEEEEEPIDMPTDGSLSKRRTLMIAHLLWKYCAAYADRNAFPALYDKLNKMGLLETFVGEYVNYVEFSDEFKRTFRKAMKDVVIDGSLSAFWRLPLDPCASRASGISRYATDFEEMEHLGEGGYGTVWMVRNRLDGQVYAVKRIELSHDGEENRRFLREVRLLSRLQHNLVVRYYNAWIEGGEDVDSDEDDDSDSLYEESSDDDNAPFDFDDEPSEISRVDQPHRSEKQYLYIQMEYCSSRTLRDLIDEGIADSRHVWEIFFQVLEALAHVHSLGVLHRDLKPANVFITSSSSIKLGDFGLSTRTGHVLVDNKSTNPSHTGGIGTFFYTAPEQRESNTHYDFKIDIYALGIIFFEMNYNFRTLAERAKTLSTLRSTSELPADFTLGVQGELIRRMLSKNPRDRPSASWLLQSDLLPRREENVVHERTVQTVCDPEGLFFSSVMSTLFSREVLPHVDIAFDLDSHGKLRKSVLYDDYGLSSKIVDTIVMIFKSHAGVHLPVSQFMPNKRNVHNEGSFFLLDEAGTVVCPGEDHITPFARYLARSFKGNRLKRYEVGNVYKRGRGGGRPSEALLCSFDIMGHGSGVAHEVEMLSMSRDIMEKLGTPVGFHRKIKINHCKILKAAISISGLDRNKFSSAASTLQELAFGDHNLEEYKEVLSRFDFEKRHLSTFLELLFYKVSPTDSSLTELNNKFEGKISSTIDDLKQLLRHCEDTCDVSLDLAMSLDIHKYSGIMFVAGWERSITKKKKILKRFYPVCFGGRYDGLVRKFSLPTSNDDTHVCGFSAVVNSLAKFCQTFGCAESPESSTCHVYIRSKVSSDHPEENYLQERAHIAICLRKAKLRVDVQADDSETMEMSLEHCRNSKIKMMVLIGEKYASDGLVEVREVEKSSVDIIIESKLPYFVHSRVFGSKDLKREKSVSSSFDPS